MNLFDFVKCKSFFDHVREVIDVNNDRKISRTEWTVFFAEELRGEYIIGDYDTMQFCVHITSYTNREYNMSGI